MNNNRSSKHFYLILILGLLTAIGPFSIDMYLPAFPDIAKGLHTTVAKSRFHYRVFLSAFLRVSYCMVRCWSGSAEKNHCISGCLFTCLLQSDVRQQHRL